MNSRRTIKQSVSGAYPTDERRALLIMKPQFLLIAILILAAACSKEEEKFELFSPEAFAYSLDSGWELNATCRVKGFQQKQENGIFTAKLSYEIDLVLPDNSEVKGVQEGLLDKTGKEKIGELEINTQIQIDSTYKAGKYFIVFSVTDDFSGKLISVKKEFELAD